MVCDTIMAHIPPYILLASERSERDTIRGGVKIRADAVVYIYIFIARCQVVVKFYRDLYFGCSLPYRSCGD